MPHFSRCSASLPSAARTPRTPRTRCSHAQPQGSSCSSQVPNVAAQVHTTPRAACQRQSCVAPSSRSWHAWATSLRPIAFCSSRCAIPPWGQARSWLRRAAFLAINWWRRGHARDRSNASRPIMVTRSCMRVERLRNGASTASTRMQPPSSSASFAVARHIGKRLTFQLC